MLYYGIGIKMTLLIKPCYDEKDYPLPKEYVTPEAVEGEKRALPCIVQRTPYGALANSQSARQEAEHYCRLGFAYVIQCCRGTGGSEGEWRPYIHEKADGQDLFAHLEKETWCGSIALVGGSAGNNLAGKKEHSIQRNHFDLNEAICSTAHYHYGEMNTPCCDGHRTVCSILR